MSNIKVAENYLENYAFDKSNSIKIKQEVEVRCKRCHRVLKNEHAKLIGYGKTCYRKHLKEIGNGKKKLF